MMSRVSVNTSQSQVKLRGIVQYPLVCECSQSGNAPQSLFIPISVRLDLGHLQTPQPRMGLGYS